jgi:Fe-S-cluster containining protein
LTTRDVERIAEATQHDQREFSYAVEGHSPYERRMKMILGKCVFLKGRKCSIYRIRPIICRFYPFSLAPSVGRGLRIAFDPACSGIGKGITRDEKFFTSLVRLASRELSK